MHPNIVMFNWNINKEGQFADAWDMIIISSPSLSSSTYQAPQRGTWLHDRLCTVEFCEIDQFTPAIEHGYGPICNHHLHWIQKVANNACEQIAPRISSCIGRFNWRWSTEKVRQDLPISINSTGRVLLVHRNCEGGDLSEASTPFINRPL